MYCLFAIYFCFISFFSQTIAKKIINRIQESSFIYKIIVVYSLTIARIAKIDTTTTIVNVANKIEDLN